MKRSSIHRSIYCIQFISTLLIAFALCSAPAVAQTRRSSINPGIKLGYQFGDRGGFVIGGELSFVFNRRGEMPYYGFLVSADHCRELIKLHFAAETGYALAGVSIGPTFITEGERYDYGITVTPYAGGFIIPYLSLTATAAGMWIGEIGSYGKLHLPLSGDWTWN